MAEVRHVIFDHKVWSTAEYFESLWGIASFQLVLVANPNAFVSFYHVCDCQVYCRVVGGIHI